MGTVPSKKRVIRICETLSEMTGRASVQLGSAGPRSGASGKPKFERPS
jgi:hypothetical protein